MTFYKYDKIKFEGKYYQAICVDEEVAVFAPISKNEDGSIHTSYKGIIVFANQKEFKDAIKFERVDVI
jgi:hypothetical protein